MDVKFEDRADAGRQLAARLDARDWQRLPVVVGLPRGGVPVAAQVSRALRAPLDILLVRKVGAPWQPELAVAAVAEGDPPVVEIDPQTLQWTGTTTEYVQSQVPRHLAEIERRRAAYLGGRPRPAWREQTVILVDDGIATGTTVRAAVLALRRHQPHDVILAAPVASTEAVELLRPLVDDLVCLQVPPGFGAVGMYYHNFDQTTDDEVLAALQHAASAAR